MKDSQVTVADGRRLAYTDIGHPDGSGVFFFHGAPMSRLHLLGLHDQLFAQGIRVVTTDRPGYGRSSPHPRRSLADWPADALALADYLEIERFLVAGHSSGGPYAVACAALLPKDRLSAAWSFPVSRTWGGLTPGRGFSKRKPSSCACPTRALRSPGVSSASVQTATVAEPFDLPEPDNAVLTDPTFEMAMVEAFRQGVIGYAQDIFVQGRPWAFEPRNIEIPVHLVHGDSDALLSIEHSRHTAELIAGSTFRTIAGHGHLTIVAELPSIASELLRTV